MCHYVWPLPLCGALNRHRWWLGWRVVQMRKMRRGLTGRRTVTNCWKGAYGWCAHTVGRVEQPVFGEVKLLGVEV